MTKRLTLILLACAVAFAAACDAAEPPATPPAPTGEEQPAPKKPEAPAAKPVEETTKGKVGEKVALPTPEAKSDAGKTYRHPVGFSFWHPSSWKVTETPDFLQLVPSDAGTSPQGPTEIYIISGESVAEDGITSPTDPQVTAYLDGVVRQLAPFLSRSGQGDPVNMTSGTGAVFDWEGANPAGTMILARVYVAIIGTDAVSLTALGFKELVVKRDAVLRRMFSSFGLGRGKVDPAVAATWTFLSNASIDNQSPWESAWSRAQAVGETATTLELRADGTFTRTEVSQAIVGAGDVWLDTGRQQEVFQGKWCAGGGTLYLIYQDDSWAVYEYRLEENRLRLVSEGKGE
ncbi:MAG: hypothetical protein ACYTAF_06230, partial [Planctomycetota bacterium]